MVMDPGELADHLRATRDETLRDKVRYMIRKCERLLGLGIAIPGVCDL